MLLWAFLVAAISFVLCGALVTAAAERDATRSSFRAQPLIVGEPKQAAIHGADIGLLSAREYFDVVSQKTVLTVDVREPARFKSGAIIGSTSIPGGVVVTSRGSTTASADLIAAFCKYNSKCEASARENGVTSKCMRAALQLQQAFPQVKVALIAATQEELLRQGTQFSRTEDLVRD